MICVELDELVDDGGLLLLGILLSRAVDYMAHRGRVFIGHFVIPLGKLCCPSLPFTLDCLR